MNSPVTQFLPHSLFMRRAGFVRDTQTRGRPWVPSVVLERREQKRKDNKIRSIFRSLCAGMDERGSWASESDRYFRDQDAPFVAMSWSEWRAQQDRDIEVSKLPENDTPEYRRAMYTRWHRINHKKYAADDAAKAPPPTPVVPLPPASTYYPAVLMDLRNDYLEFPAMYFSGPEEQREALEEIEAEIMQTPSAWRLAAAKLQEMQVPDTVIEIPEQVEVVVVAEAPEVAGQEFGLPEETPVVQETPAPRVFENDSTPHIPATVRGVGCKTPLSFKYCYCEFCRPRKTKKVKRHYHSNICYCGDDMCARDCGAMPCGRCIDCCRCGYDEGYFSN